jgi:hypothetical protein
MAGNGIYQGFAGRVGQGLFVFGGDYWLACLCVDEMSQGLSLPVACPMHHQQDGAHLLPSGAVALGAALERAMSDQ